LLFGFDKRQLTMPHEMKQQLKDFWQNLNS